MRTYAGSLGNLQVLIKHDANPHVADGKGNTLLHEATRIKADDTFDIIRDKHSIVDFLLDKKVRLDSLNHAGQNPLHVAALTCHYEVVEHLVANGADVNALSRDGQSALDFAFTGAYGDPYGEVQDACFKHLLNRGANPNVADNRGNTVLHSVVERGDAKNVARLLKAGATVNPNTNGFTPLDWATEDENYEITKLLSGASAKLEKSGNTVCSKRNDPDCIDESPASSAKRQKLDEGEAFRS